MYLIQWTNLTEKTGKTAGMHVLILIGALMVI